MAFTNWTTMTNFFMKLYSTSESENYEFEISPQFINPKFMVFWNNFSIDGNIVGLKASVQNIGTNRYKVVPLVRTTSDYAQFISPSTSGAIGSTTGFTLGALPMTRKIHITGYIHPVHPSLNGGTIWDMNGTVDVEILDTLGNPIYGVSNLNVYNNGDGNKIMHSYFFNYFVPSQFYQSGVQVRYKLTQIKGSICFDNLQVVTTGDLIWQDSGGGTLTSGGYKFITPSYGTSLTILVTEGSNGDTNIYTTG